MLVSELMDVEFLDESRIMVEYYGSYIFVPKNMNFLTIDANGCVWAWKEQPKWVEQTDCVNAHWRYDGIGKAGGDYGLELGTFNFFGLLTDAETTLRGINVSETN